MRYCTAAKIAETFLLLPSPNSLVDGFVSNLTLGYYIWYYGYRYIRAFYEPGREKYLCIYNNNNNNNNNNISLFYEDDILSINLSNIWSST